MPFLLLLLTALICPAQTAPDGEELALRTDPAWQQLVVVLSNGRRVTYQRADVKTVLYVGGDFSSSFTGGTALSGEAHANGRVGPFKIRITNHTPANGAIIGEITWSSLSSVHRIRGKLSGATLTFEETEAIRAGGAHLHCTYSMTVSATGAKGTWIDPADNSRGTIVIHNK